MRLSALELQTADDTIASLEAQNEKLYEAAQSNKLTSEQLLREIRQQTDANHELDAALRVAENNRLHAGGADFRRRGRGKYRRGCHCRRNGQS